MKSATKIMLWLHKYTGLICSLLFLFWFLSGFVMMYKSFPYLLKEESLQRSEAIKGTEKWIPVTEILNTYGKTDMRWVAVKASRILGRPVYTLQDSAGLFHGFYADDGSPLPDFTASDAGEITKSFMGASCEIASIEEMKALDQWTPRSKFLPYLPAYKVHLKDGKGTTCYVSSVTGTVFQKLDTADRIWAWLGPIPHWIYFKGLRIRAKLWSNVVIYISLFGCVMCLSGIVMGLIRFKKRRKAPLAFSPYKKFWFKWHHYIGFVFGLFTFTWILSGLFSMNPWHWSPSTYLSKDDHLRWQGGPLQVADFGITPDAYWAQLEKAPSVPVEMTWFRFASRPYYQVWFKDGHTCLLHGDRVSKPIQELPKQYFTDAIQQLHPNEAIASVDRLTEYDAYYYNKHHTKPLPVLRVMLHDANHTRYYIDPKEARVVMKYQGLAYANRWLYHGLHSLDFPGLFFKRPLWDIVVIFLMMGGTALSVTGIALTWKWSKRKARKAMMKKQGI